MGKRGVLLALVALGIASAVPSARATWSPPSTLSDGASAEDSSVAVGPEGRAVVAWLRHYDGSTRSLEARVDNGHGFGRALVLSEPFRTDPYAYADNWEPAVAMDADGRAIVAWQYEGSVRTRVIEPGAEAAAEPQTVSKALVESALPQVAFDDEGRATVGWTDGYSGGVFAATRAPGAQFGEPKLLFAPTDLAYSATDLDLAASSSSSVAVWRTRRQVMAAVREARDAFAPALTLKAYDPEVQITPLWPRAAVDRDGDVLVTWNDDLDGWRTWATVRAAGGQFEPPVLLAEHGESTDAYPFFDSAGRPTVIGLDHDRIVRRRLADGQWGNPEPLVTEVQPYDRIRVALDAGDNVYVAWRDYYDDLLGQAWGAMSPSHATGPVRPSIVSGQGENVWPGALAAGAEGQALLTWSRGTFPSAFRLEGASWQPDVSDPSGQSAPPHEPVSPNVPGPAPASDPSQGMTSAFTADHPPSRLARQLARQLARSLAASRLGALRSVFRRRRGPAGATSTATVLVRVPRSARPRAIARATTQSSARGRWHVTAVGHGIRRRARRARGPIRVGVRVLIVSATGHSGAEAWATLPRRRHAR